MKRPIYLEYSATTQVALPGRTSPMRVRQR